MGVSDDRVYSAKAEDLISAFNIAASVLSFMGASFVLWNYWKFENLRTFAFKLIFFVAIGDMINCIGNFMGSPSGKDQRGLCVLQAMTLQFGDLVSFLWVTSVAWIIHRVLTSEETITADDAEKWFRRMHCIIWPTALTLCLLPFVGNTYGPAGGFCWIKRCQMGNIWRWLCYYVPLWLCIAYMVYIYANVWNQISATTAEAEAQNTADGNGDAVQPPKQQQSGSDVVTGGRQPSDMHSSDYEEAKTSDWEVAPVSSLDVTEEKLAEEKSQKSAGSTLSRIKYYPVILFCCYFFATVRRLVEVFSHEKAPVPLSVIQVATSSLLGFCNAMVYGLTPTVRATDNAYFSKLCGRSTRTTSKMRLTDGAATDEENEIEIDTIR